MATRTALDLITASLQTLGVYGAAETLSAEDAKLGMDTLQDLLAEWSDGGIVVPCTVTEAITLAIGQAAYVVGESGVVDLDTVRPDQVMSAYVRDSAGYDYEVKVIGENAYQTLQIKSSNSGRPDRIFPLYTSPNIIVYTYPVPEAVESLYITSLKPFTEPATYTEDLLATTEIPRNYYNALKYNLAMELSLPFLRDPSPMLVKRAMNTKKVISNLNMARTVEPVDIGFPGRKVAWSLADFFEG